MNDSARAEFFAREAGEYLQQLEPLVNQPAAPSPEALLRLARALRGAAMLAGPRSVTEAASALEQLAKCFGEGGVAWDAIAPPVRLAVSQLRRLVGAARAWNAECDAEAAAVASGLRAAGTGLPSSAPDGAELAARLQAGRRAFVAREAAATAGATALAARALAGAAVVPEERLAAVSRAAESLRGLADLAEFEPLPALLDALDAGLAELTSAPSALPPPPPPGAADFFFAVAGALGRIGRDVASHGAVAADLPEVNRVADLLHRMLCSPDAVVPVEHLLAEPTRVRTHELPPAEPADLIGLGERLRQAAGQLHHARSPAGTALAAVTLLAWLRHARRLVGHRPVATFLQRLLTLLEAAPHPASPGPLAAVLDGAGRQLIEGAGGDPALLAATLDAITPALASLAAPADGEEPVIPIEELLETEPVPIESLAPDAPPVPSDRTALERSLSSYSRRVRASGVPPAARREIAAPSALGSQPAAGEPVVPIESLLYAGRAALLRADEVRRELETALRGAPRPLEQVEPLVRELLDLVPLALADER